MKKAKLKAAYAAAEKAGQFTMSKCGKRRLRRALCANSKLDIVAWVEQEKRADAKKVWARMSPAQRVEFMKSIDNKQPQPKKENAHA